MEPILNISKQNQKTQYIIQLAQNAFSNSDADVYRRIREFIKNHDYDFQNKSGVYIISTLEELKNDLKIYLIRKDNPSLNAKVQYFLGVFTLISLGIYAISEIVDSY